MAAAWTLRGELVLACNCTVFCPCTLSLGKAPPTEGYCQTWAGIRIDEGRFDTVDLSGVSRVVCRFESELRGQVRVCVLGGVEQDFNCGAGLMVARVEIDCSAYDAED